MSGKRSRKRPRLTFENTVSKILKKEEREGHVKSMRTPWSGCMMMEVDDSGRGQRGIQGP